MRVSVQPKLEYQLEDFEKRWYWSELHEELKRATKMMGTTNAGTKIANKDLNRYATLVPYDHNRVRLHDCHTDYINASLISVPHISCSYIITQAPLPLTAPHFWLMVWQQNSPGVVMLTESREEGLQAFHMYYPDNIKLVQRYPHYDIEVKLLRTECDPRGEYLVRFCRIRVRRQIRDIVHLQYLKWTVGDVPADLNSFLHFVTVVRRHGLMTDAFRPPVVHCTNGIGRTGLFVLTDVCLTVVNQRGSMKYLDLMEELAELRKKRLGLLQTPQQLRFCYWAATVGGKKLMMAKDFGLGDGEVQFR